MDNKINVDKLFDNKEIINLKSEDILKISDSRDEWCNLLELLNSEKCTLKDVDINEILEYVLINRNFTVDKTLKSMLRNINVQNINKESLSLLFVLEGDDKEYMEILKNIVSLTNIHKDMIFYDYEDNDYDNGKSEDLIVKKLNIEKEKLYPAYTSSMFESENFKSPLITNLTGFYDEDYYESCDYKVILY